MGSSRLGTGIAGPIGAVALIVAITFVLAEIAVRAIFPQPEVPGFDRADFTRQSVVGSLLPASLAHASFRYDSAPDGAFSIHGLNLNGFRDEEWAAPTDSGQRIAFVGDSFVEGFLAPADATIPRAFARAMGTSGRQKEVLNLGVGAAGLKEYLQIFRQALPLLRPARVVLVLYANDLLGPQEYEATSQIVRTEEPLRETSKLRLFSVVREVIEHRVVPRRWHSKTIQFLPSVPNPANPWTRQRSALEPLVEPEFAAAMMAGTFNCFNVCEIQIYAQYLPKPVNIRPWLEVLDGLAKANGAQLYLTYVPHAAQTSDYYLPYKRRFCTSGAISLLGEDFQKSARMIETASRGLGLPFLDLTPGIRAEESRGRHLYWNFDEHMRPEGYLFVGEQIALWMKQIDAGRATE